MEIMGVISFLNQGWVGVLIGVLVSLVTFILSRKRAKLCAHFTASHELAWGSSPKLPPGITIQFDGNEIPNIARGIFRFWNNGTESLECQKVASADPLRLEIPDGEFLLARVSTATKEANLFAVEIDPNNHRIVKIQFDFLDPKDGVAVGFLHTSTSAVPTLKGTVKGHPIDLAKLKSKRLRATIRRSLDSKFTRILGIIMILIALVSLTASIFSASQLDKFRSLVDPYKLLTEQDKAREFRLAMGFTGVIYLAAGTLLWWGSRRKYPKTLEIAARVSKEQNDEQSQ